MLPVSEVRMAIPLYETVSGNAAWRYFFSWQLFSLPPLADNVAGKGQPEAELECIAEI
jgi:hypothetical protein